MSLPPRAEELQMIGCHGCGLACEAPAPEVRRPACPRCGHRLHRRRANSIQRSWALLIAALIVYLPANILPVMQTNLLGQTYNSTILGGVWEFWNYGSYDIAAIIFIASVAVPCAKFLTMGLLLYHAQRRSTWAMPERARLYRAVEFIGYWSMLDVLVVAIVSALVGLKPLGQIEPQPGILFFGLAVILTMLAAMQFDPRLTWDGERP